MDILEKGKIREYVLHKRNHDKVIFLFYILLFSILFLPSFTVHADEPIETSEFRYDQIDSESVGISIQYGLNQEGRYGRDLYINVEIHSVELAGDYSFMINFSGNSDKENVKYGKIVDLKAGETMKISFTVPMTRELSYYKAELTNNMNHTIVEQVFPLKLNNYGTYKLIGILSDTPDCLSYFDAFGSKCYYLDESNFPSDKDGLDMLDILVINDYDCSALKEEQFKALIGFVSNGGTLVLGTGKEVTKTLNAFYSNNILGLTGMNDASNLRDIEVSSKLITLASDEYLKRLTEDIGIYENTRINVINRVEELKKSESVPIPYIYIGKSVINSTLISELTIKPIKKEIALFNISNASRYFVNEGIPMFQKLKYGDGNFLITSFSLSMTQKVVEGEVINMNYLSVIKMIFDNMDPSQTERLQMESYGNNYETAYSDIARYTEKEDVPGIIGFTVILILYVIIVGPVVFIILKKIDKSKYIWGIVPLISVFFVFVIYITGYRTRITEPVVNYLNVEKYNSETKAVDGQVNFELSFPTNDDSEVTLATTNQVNILNDNIPAYYFYYMDNIQDSNTYVDSNSYRTGIFYNKNGVTIERTDSPAFSKTRFETSYTVKKEQPINVDIILTENEIKGTISNQGDTSYKNAYLFYRGFLFTLDSLDNGATIQLENCQSEYFMNQEMIYRSKLLESLLKYNDWEQVTAKSQGIVSALQSVLSEIQKDSETAYFISYTEELEKGNPIYELSKNKASHGVNIYLVPFQVDLEENNSILVPSMDSYMQVVEGEYQVSFNYRYLLTDTLVIDYNLPKDENVTEVIVSEFFNHTIQGNYSSLICDEILFYNNVTETYDTVFNLHKINTKEYSSDNMIIERLDGDSLNKYLSEENKLRVKFKSGNTIESLAVLPYISYRKEVLHVTNQ